MEPYRLKIKVGEHEFEAEGPASAVQSQFEAWKALIAELPRQTRTEAASNGGPDRNNKAQNDERPDQGVIALDKILKADGRVVSLTATASNEHDAAMLIMLGQRSYRSNESVTGSEMMDGLQQSGIRVGRVDRLMEHLVAEGLIIRTGAHRGTRYRLSNQGYTRAQAIAREVIATVA